MAKRKRITNEQVKADYAKRVRVHREKKNRREYKPKE